jgi:alpha-tubulin suppressor-like RCC1 family protein
VLQPAGTRFVDIAVAANHTSCGLEESGRVYCWGYEVPLGSGFGTRKTPTLISQPDSVRFASLWDGRREASCALTSSGQAWCWGWLPWGIWPSAAAIPQPKGVHFSSLGVGWAMCGLTSAGQAYCAGSNESGQIGDGTNEYRSDFVPVHQLPGVTFISISIGGASCGLTASGQAYCWGDNYEGQLGDGTTEDRLVPVAVHQPPGVSFEAISTSGTFHVCALSSGQAYCWGVNWNGNLGDGTLTAHHVPAPVRQAPGLLFSAVTAGLAYTCALEQGTGQPYCWGANYLGQLGDGTTEGRLVPVAVGR